MFPLNVPTVVNNLSLQRSERFHKSGGEICTGAGCPICTRYRNFWAAGQEQQARDIKPIERFYYSSSIGELPVGKTLHEEFKALGPNVKVLKTMVDQYVRYDVTRI